MLRVVHVLTTFFVMQVSSFCKPSSTVQMQSHTTNHSIHSIAVGFAGYSLIRKLFVDGTLRLSRSRGHNQAAAPSDPKSGGH